MAQSRSCRPILSLEIVTAETFQKLMDRLPLAETYHTDRYRVYDAFSRRHRVIGKGGKVNRNEGLHSRLRDSLYRLRRQRQGPCEVSPDA